MNTFEVFSYWNLTELQLTFNAIASIVGGGDFLGLLRTLALVGLISMAMAVLAGFAQLPDFGRWIIMLAIFNGMLLVPKVPVLITDRTGGQASIVVSNVPIGLAAFASSISHIGDWLTRTYETTFSVIPNDLSFISHGALWGQRVQQEMLHTKFSSSILQTNLLDFYRECVVPEYATGFVVASDMAKSSDIWLYLNGKTNPGRFVTIRAMQGSAVVAGTYGCDAGYIYLTDQVNVDSAKNITSLGGLLFPKQATGTANASITSSIQTSTNYILGVSQTAMQSIRQTAMTNFMIDAQYNLPAQ
ncbi:MAG: conjugal transfer protein TraG N-terminal domain-containing protein, partial [Gallionella sp.]